MGGSVVTESPKRGISKTFGRTRDGGVGGHSNLLGQCQTLGRSPKLSIVIGGDHFNEITFKGGSAKFPRV